MKKKYLIIALTGSFILISGICYSCAYREQDSAAIVALTSGNILSQTDIVAESIDITPIIENVISKTDSSDKDNVLEVRRESVIFVHICGAVKIPGVYQVAEGARLIDVIKLSGGLTETAAGDYMNQAQIVSDGQRIYIPTSEELKDLPASELQAGDQLANKQNDSETISNSKLININTADKERLKSLPGIGEAKAKAIIDFRTTNGNFTSVEELMTIPGIKEGLYNQIASLIVVN